ncbi:ORM1-like protein 3 [Canna indica]|uniref:ORM1-like protein 3 n=1 Tax=Canna indica TaxID=4628 RepID=A0AAQ3KC67_9LILI|nr:ORM1-like protein 3 [Canna indica]
MAKLYVQAVPPAEMNKNTEWFMYPGVWTTYILILFFSWLLVLSVSGCTPGTAWTIVNLCHFSITYHFFHWKKGTPFSDDQGIYNSLTWWEQIDSGKQLTRNRKFLTVVPVVLFDSLNSLNEKSPDVAEDTLINDGGLSKPDNSSLQLTNKNPFQYSSSDQSMPKLNKGKKNIASQSDKDLFFNSGSSKEAMLVKVDVDKCLDKLHQKLTDTFAITVSEIKDEIHTISDDMDEDLIGSPAINQYHTTRNCKFQNAAILQNTSLNFGNIQRNNSMPLNVHQDFGFAIFCDASWAKENGQSDYDFHVLNDKNKKAIMGYGKSFASNSLSAELYAI